MAVGRVVTVMAVEVAAARAVGGGIGNDGRGGGGGGGGGCGCGGGGGGSGGGGGKVREAVVVAVAREIAVEIVMELLVAEVVAVVVEVEVSVMVGVRLITFTDKLLVLTKTILISHFMILPHSNQHPASTLCNAPPSTSPLPLPPHVDSWVPPLLTPACRSQHCENAIALPTCHH